jgi:hypothetical protein
VGSTEQTLPSQSRKHFLRNYNGDQKVTSKNIVVLEIFSLCKEINLMQYKIPHPDDGFDKSLPTITEYLPGYMA